MAHIILVHGIAQEQHSAAELETTWIPSLAGGVENAGHIDLADQIRAGSYSIRMAFYGNQFLVPDQQGTEPNPFTDPEQTLVDELAWDLLANACGSDDAADAAQAKRALSALASNRADAQGPLRRTTVRVAAGLDRIPWFSRGTLTAVASINRTLAQVVRYLSDPSIRAYALDQVARHLDDDTRVVIGHSLGSVVAYEALHARRSDHLVPLFLTLGSPLALSAIAKRIQPQPPAFPSAVRRWVNIASPDDLVAARSNLAPIFDNNRPETATLERTWKVDNGSKPHQATFYLTKPVTGRAVGDTLRLADRNGWR
ncbi:hypothetical protein ACIG56_26500 [Nocardia fusca]|uniref:hypothetical protein n=1 Tax=Nocardia fusca TaxID=941183 RepID=UPI0037C913AF